MVSDTDRKLLWAKAGNKCSFRFNGEICSRNLILLDGNEEVITGRECHIVDKKESTSRYISDFPDRESYINFILLCQDHHTLIDSNGDKYTVDILKRMKKEHEENIAIKIKDQNQDLIINDYKSDISVKNTKKVIGMEINKPAILKNVTLNVNAENTEHVVGFSTNQGLTSIAMSCPSCNNNISIVYTGTKPSTLKCQYCNNFL